MRKKIALVTAAGLLASVVALSGCGGGSNSSGGTSSAQGAAGGAGAGESKAEGGDAAGSGEALHLTFYYPVNVGGSAAQLIEGLCSDFNAENPDIVVEPVYTGNYDDTVTKLQTAEIGRAHV